MKKNLLFAFCFLLSASCFAQSTPCGFQYGKTEKDSLACLEAISLFKTFYDQKNYKDAYLHWKEVVDLCPCSWNAIFNNTYLQTMFSNLIDQSGEDETLKNQYIDDLLDAFATRHKYFTNYTEGNGLGFKAFFMIKYRGKTTEDILAAFDLFIESIEMEKDKTQPNIWDMYFNIAKQIATGKKDTTIMIDAYERATDYIEMAINEYHKKIDKQLPNFENLQQAYDNAQISETDYQYRLGNLSKDTANSMKLIDNYQKTLKNIENTFTPFAPCHVLEQVYSNKLENSKEDLSKLKKMLLTMNSRRCTESPVFVEILNIVHQAEPSAQTANLMGYYSLQNFDYDAAIDFFKEAIDLFETNEQKVDPWYMIGSAYMVKNDYSKAREAALNAIKLKSNCGKAYILIGDLYANSGSRCSGDDVLPLDYNWAADDKYARAAAVDSSVADEAREKRRKVQAHFPAKLDKFQRGIEDGAQYKIGCWIQETTTVR